LVVKRKRREMTFILLFLSHNRKVVSWFLAIIVSSFALLPGKGKSICAESVLTPRPFASLQLRLIHDGFDSSEIRALYSRSEVTFQQQDVVAYFMHKEAALNYEQFLTQPSIKEATEYLKKNGCLLRKAQHLYGVEPEIITAIMLVESRFGTCVGKHLVFNTLSTLAALADEANRNRLWHIRVKRKMPGSKAKFNRWANQKSTWAYRELKALLRYVKSQKIDPFSLYGSYAGAMGFAQFIPSSVLEFGQDGNRDGHINLCQQEDAISSIANYLKQHGWRLGLSRDKALEILLYYNQSTYYADTILKVAKRLSRTTLN